MSTMRIAVAGTGGLACLIAHFISEETTHGVVLLSRAAKPALTQRGLQITIVDYNDADNLKYALRGIDTVISTVTGPNQIHLIKAAVSARVRRFAPAEFEGPPQLRPPNDPLDRQRTAALSWLRHYRNNIEHTVFVCGIFYERFQPGGLPRALIARNTGYHGEGSYIFDFAKMSAESPSMSPSNQPDVTICMTSVRDVARFVTKAIDLPTWPPELRMCGERVTVHNLTILVQRIKKERFQPFIVHNVNSIRTALAAAAVQGDRARGIKLQMLLATAEGRYDFTQRNLNAAFPGLQVDRFAGWFVKKWDLEQDDE
ncbi:hypothetical protein Q7P35_005605 [Cladosporium inversicolor]